MSGISPRPPASTDFSRPSAHLQAPSDAATNAASTWDIHQLDRRFDDFREYARTALGHATPTLAWYRVAYRNFRTFLLQRGASREAIGADLFAIETWLRWNRDLKRTPVTLRNYYRGLECFFRDLGSG